MNATPSIMDAPSASTVDTRPSTVVVVDLESIEGLAHVERIDIRDHETTVHYTTRESGGEIKVQTCTFHGALAKIVNFRVDRSREIEDAASGIPLLGRPVFRGTLDIDFDPDRASERNMWFDGAGTLHGSGRVGICRIKDDDTGFDMVLDPLPLLSSSQPLCRFQ